MKKLNKIRELGLKISLRSLYYEVERIRSDRANRDHDATEKFDPKTFEALYEKYRCGLGSPPESPRESDPDYHPDNDTEVNCQSDPDYHPDNDTEGNSQSDPEDDHERDNQGSRANSCESNHTSAFDRDDRNEVNDQDNGEGNCSGDHQDSHSTRSDGICVSNHENGSGSGHGRAFEGMRPEGDHLNSAADIDLRPLDSNPFEVTQEDAVSPIRSELPTDKSTSHSTISDESGNNSDTDSDATVPLAHANESQQTARVASEVCRSHNVESTIQTSAIMLHPTISANHTGGDEDDEHDDRLSLSPLPSRFRKFLSDGRQRVLSGDQLSTEHKRLTKECVAYLRTLREIGQSQKADAQRLEQILVSDDTYRPEDGEVRMEKWQEVTRTYSNSERVQKRRTAEKSLEETMAKRVKIEAKVTEFMARYINGYHKASKTA